MEMLPGIYRWITSGRCYVDRPALLLQFVQVAALKARKPTVQRPDHQARRPRALCFSLGGGGYLAGRRGPARRHFVPALLSGRLGKIGMGAWLGTSCINVWA